KAPVELERVRVKEYNHAAGGMGAILSTMKQVGQMGAVRGTATLLHMNQPGGFDCPGCAWPDADPGERPIAEFCENGAKAAAAEATTERVTPAFFAEWPISRLLEQTDHWLEAQGRLTHPMARRPD